MVFCAAGTTRAVEATAAPRVTGTARATASARVIGAAAAAAAAAATGTARVIGATGAMGVTTAVSTGIIPVMPDVEEMITITQAAELADGRYTRRHIVRAAREGAFPGAVQMGRIWLIPRTAFDVWLNEKRRPGPKTDN